MQVPKAILISINILPAIVIEFLGRDNIATVFGEKVSPAKDYFQRKYKYTNILQINPTKLSTCFYKHCSPCLENKTGFLLGENSQWSEVRKNGFLQIVEPVLWK